MADTTPTIEPRAVAQPISIRVETITELPDVRELPHDTLRTVNLKMSRHQAIEVMILLSKQLLKNSIDFVVITVTGVS